MANVNKPQGLPTALQRQTLMWRYLQKRSYLFQHDLVEWIQRHLSINLHRKKSINSNSQQVWTMKNFLQRQEKQLEGTTSKEDR